MPVFAYVTNSSQCDNNVLSTYSGSANLTANWQGNPITVTWYNGDTQYASNSCTYGGNLTMPSSIPQKTGYTFRGWRVRQQPCSFASSVCGLTGSQVTALTFSDATGDPNLGWKGDSSHQYLPSMGGTYDHNGSKYGLTEDYTWAVEFTNGGVARGIASCNDTRSNSLDSIMEAIMDGTISDEDFEQAYMGALALYGNCSSDVFKSSGTFNQGSTGGQKCWCKMTSYTPSGGSACNIASSSWVYIADADMYTWHEGCEGDCVYYCAYMFSSNDSASVYRAAIWGVAQ